MANEFESAKIGNRSEKPGLTAIEFLLQELPPIAEISDHLQLAVKDFRLRFVVEGAQVCVHAIESGYKPRVLADPHAPATERTPLSVHRAFAARFAT